jgi:hypothetical protein
MNRYRMPQKRRFLGFAWLLLLLLPGSVSLQGQMMTGITVSAPAEIVAGDAWQMDIEVVGAVAGERVETLLLNGLHIHTASLQLGSGGVARWVLPAGQLSVAGDSLAIVRSGDHEVQTILTVWPGPPETLNLLTSANTLAAYGEQRGMVVALGTDEWGNALQSTTARVEAFYPDGRRRIQMLPLQEGLAWMWIASRGEPGRLRVSSQLDAHITDSLDIKQAPGPAASITLAVDPPCLTQADGRDIIVLEAQVSDAYGALVADGTRVLFVWPDGAGTGSVLSGRAILRIPVPAETGTVEFTAMAGTAQSSARVQLAERACP